jgi:hypothetical protein
MNFVKYERILPKNQNCREKQQIHLRGSSCFVGEKLDAFVRMFPYEALPLAQKHLTDRPLGAAGLRCQSTQRTKIFFGRR